MRSLSDTQNQISVWRDLEQRSAALSDLVTLAQIEKDTSLTPEISNELEDLTILLENEESELTLSGQYDAHDAILTLYAGAGGTESQDWAQMLLRMYSRWVERQGIKIQELDMSYGDEAGIKSATMKVSGKFAYGHLKSERGVHRLVRISPFDAKHHRHTSFAMVEILPSTENNIDADLRQEDLKTEFFRSGGPGGQNVQKISSAVRITHIPTGLVVSCQNERSQAQNREYALMILRARLLDLKREEKAKEMADIKGATVSAEWGNQIRCYVLHPYKMVKDHRTEKQTSNADAVLDGDIKEFINSYLLWTVRSSNVHK
jgi:peptide chain release factor 2